MLGIRTSYLSLDVSISVMRLLCGLRIMASTIPRTQLPYLYQAARGWLFPKHEVIKSAPAVRGLLHQPSFSLVVSCFYLDVKRNYEH